MQTKYIPIGHIHFNEGQIPGVPKNPRNITEEAMAELVKSLQDLPELMMLRELIVFPWEDDTYITIGGNQRLAGCIQVGTWSELPCKVLPKEMPMAKVREIAIKDNMSYGRNDWEILKDWNMDELQAWGMDIEPLQDPEEEPAANDRMKHQKEIRLKYPEDVYLMVRETLNTIAETPELAILRLIGEAEWPDRAGWIERNIESPQGGE